MLTWRLLILLLAKAALSLELHPFVQEEVEVQDMSWIASQDEPFVDSFDRLKFSAFQKDFDLPLAKAEIDFSRDFQILSTSDLVNGRSYRKKKRNFANFPRGTFYSIRDGPGTIYVEHDDHGPRVEGIIDETIRLLPHHSGSPHRHRAVRLQKQIYHPNAFEGDIAFQNFEQRVNFARNQNILSPQKPFDTAFLETLVIFDYKNAAALNMNKTAIYRYVGIFWNSIQKLYSHLRNPRVKFVITGVLISASPDEERYITSNLIGGNQLDGVKTLQDLTRYLKFKKSQLPPHDFAMLQTGLDLGKRLTGGSFEPNLLGRAWVSTLCQPTHSCGESEDQAPYYTGILTVAHEAGHIFSLSHDGEQGSSACNKSAGYIMSSHLSYDPNAYIFSKCSETVLQSFLQKAECVRNRPKTAVPMIQVLPGEGMTLRGACESKYGIGSAVLKKKQKFCSTLWCITPNKQIRPYHNLPEGISCDTDGKICLKGRCVMRPWWSRKPPQKCSFQ